MAWTSLSSWWLDEVNADPAYEAVVSPLLLEVLRPEADVTYLDLGSGEGRVMRELQERGVGTIGVDVSEALARRSTGTVVVARLPEIPIHENSVDGAYCVLVLEHLSDHETLFREVGRVTKAGGVFALVSNHPTWTAPKSTPITDSDGEVLWRPGEYFSHGVSETPAGESTVVFHHRTMSDLVNAAAENGWTLETMVERPHHEFSDQAGIPRLLACRWRLKG